MAMSMNIGYNMGRFKLPCIALIALISIQVIASSSTPSTLSTSTSASIFVTTSIIRGSTTTTGPPASSIATFPDVNFDSTSIIDGGSVLPNPSISILFPTTAPAYNSTLDTTTGPPTFVEEQVYLIYGSVKDANLTSLSALLNNKTNSTVSAWNEQCISPYRTSAYSPGTNNPTGTIESRIMLCDNIGNFSVRFGNHTPGRDAEHQCLYLLRISQKLLSAISGDGAPDGMVVQATNHTVEDEYYKLLGTSYYGTTPWFDVRIGWEKGGCPDPVKEADEWDRITAAGWPNQGPAPTGGMSVKRAKAKREAVPKLDVPVGGVFPPIKTLTLL
ncbi:hypothetical protein TWF694_007221 [Orbilia ellipsospora]|uniref:Uncharacterized protein n=1 Tax=Orbilia ellipsospora TaxID=2528407 RepID=A0AAV9XJS1_9PEZI